MDISAQKKELRKICRNRRDLISAKEWKACGTIMSEILIKTPMWKEADSVFCFVSMDNETNTSLLIETALKQGKTLCVPRIVGDGIMETVRIKNVNELVTSSMGIKEPSKSITETIAPNDIALAVVPCLAMTTDGERLGKGGGYYDRFLEQFHGESVVLCHNNLIFKKEEIPIDKYDKKINHILSQTGFIK